MPRYIDADELLTDKNQHYDWLSDEHYVRVRTIELMPTADVVEVVRCRKCKWWNYKKLLCECPKWTDMDGWHKATDADDYCFRAERKEKTDG